MNALDILRQFKDPRCAHEIEFGEFASHKCPNIRAAIKTLKDLHLIEPTGEFFRSQMGRPAGIYVASKEGRHLLESHD